MATAGMSKRGTITAITAVTGGAMIAVAIAAGVMIAVMATAGAADSRWVIMTGTIPAASIIAATTCASRRAAMNGAAAMIAISLGQLQPA